MIPVLVSLFAAVRVFFQTRTDICCRSHRTPPPDRRPEEETAATAFAPSRSALLDGPAHNVVPLARRAGDRKARNGSRLASGRLPTVLALEIAAGWRPAEDHPRSS